MKTIWTLWMALAAVICLALLPLGCSLQSTSATEQLDKLMARQNAPDNEVRSLLMSMKD